MIGYRSKTASSGFKFNAMHTSEKSLLCLKQLSMLWFIWWEPSMYKIACLSYCAKARGMGGNCVHTLCVRFMYVKLTCWCLNLEALFIKIATYLSEGTVQYIRTTPKERSMNYLQRTLVHQTAMFGDV